MRSEVINGFVHLFILAGRALTVLFIMNGRFKNVLPTIAVPDHTYGVHVTPYGELYVFGKSSSMRIYSVSF